MCKKVQIARFCAKKWGGFFHCKINKLLTAIYSYVKTISNNTRSAPDFITTVPRGYHA